MGKTYSIYLDEKQAQEVEKHRKEGLSKTDAVKKVLTKGSIKTHEEHEYIIKLLEDIRSAPILQLTTDKEKAFIKVQQPESEMVAHKKGIWHKLSKK